MKYKPTKTIMKTIEFPAIVILGANALLKILQQFGLELDLDTCMVVCLVLYSALKGLRNYLKNR